MSAESSAKAVADKALRKVATGARRSAKVPPERAKYIADLRAQLAGSRAAGQSFAALAALPDVDLLRHAREENLKLESICAKRSEQLLRELMEACGAPVSRKERAS